MIDVQDTAQQDEDAENEREASELIVAAGILQVCSLSGVL